MPPRVPPGRRRRPPLDLAASIRAHGLRHPIVLDRAGRLVDGRNRLVACRRAGVEPSYAVLPDDMDAEAYIRSENVERRHLTKAQRTMAAVVFRILANDVSRGWQKALEQESDLKQTAISMAAIVARRDDAGALRYPDLVQAVMGGTQGLVPAYEEAKRRWEEDATAEERERQAARDRAELCRGASGALPR